MTDKKDQPAPAETRMLDAGRAAPAQGANTDDIETHVLATSSDRVVAWLVVTAGPFAGQKRAVCVGTNGIGRDPNENRIALDIGDAYISRAGHAVIVHDDRAESFRLIDGGKSNGVRVNGRAITGEQALQAGDAIEIGATTLRFEIA